MITTMPTTALATLILPTLMAFTPSSALPPMRTAPQQCPMENGNLIRSELFVTDEAACESLCGQEDRCFFYYFYAGEGSSSFNAIDQPSQCFLYDECNRKVLPATENCPIDRLNAVNVSPFVLSEDDCEASCSQDTACAYFKYYNETDERQPLMCYHLRSCSVRVIRNMECPIEPNNYIRHIMFTKSNENCRTECENDEECRFFFWYPIDYSPAPLYCYLFRSCEGGADERRLALIVAGRHPGYYFVDQTLESLEVVRSQAVCEKEIVPEDTTVGRAGAVSEWVGGRVLLCGGRDHDGQVRSNCLAYDPMTNEWSEDSDMGREREEAASVVIDDEVLYVIGGFISDQRTVSTDMLNSDGTWTLGPDLPEPRSRFCAVYLKGLSTFAILGGETDEFMATADMKTYNVSTEEWVTQPEMIQTRKDHACLYVEIDGESGILVTGGVDEEENLLDSAEFYSLQAQFWRSLRPLKRGRTEHGMAMIAGQPTVIGGVAEDEFLRSVEILDNSAANETAIDGMDWRIAAHDLNRPRYDFAVAQVPISAFPEDEQSLNSCASDAEMVEEA